MTHSIGRWPPYARFLFEKQTGSSGFSHSGWHHIVLFSLFPLLVPDFSAFSGGLAAEPSVPSTGNLSGKAAHSPLDWIFVFHPIVSGGDLPFCCADRQSHCRTGAIFPAAYATIYDSDSKCLGSSLDTVGQPIDGTAWSSAKSDSKLHRAVPRQSVLHTAFSGAEHRLFIPDFRTEFSAGCAHCAAVLLFLHKRCSPHSQPLWKICAFPVPHIHP